MTGKRRVGLGSVVVKQSGGGGAATASKQGGGNKLIGLISTKNRAINGAMVRSIRTRSDGGQSRHWFFCVNQLGGVGRKWGQSGPGNRGGVSAGCAALARQSRIDFPLARHRGNPLTPAEKRALSAVAALKLWYEGNKSVQLPTSVTVSASDPSGAGIQFDKTILTGRQGRPRGSFSANEGKQLRGVAVYEAAGAVLVTRVSVHGQQGIELAADPHTPKGACATIGVPCTLSFEGRTITVFGVLVRVPSASPPGAGSSKITFYDAAFPSS